MHYSALIAKHSGYPEFKASTAWEESIHSQLGSSQEYHGGKVWRGTAACLEAGKQQENRDRDEQTRNRYRTQGHASMTYPFIPKSIVIY